jgi:hypothetical protein
MQNIRFLNSTASSTLVYPKELNLKLPLIYYYLVYPITFFLIFGFFFIEDLFLLFTWLFN